MASSTSHPSYDELITNSQKAKSTSEALAYAAARSKNNMGLESLQLCGLPAVALCGLRRAMGIVPNRVGGNVCLHSSLESWLVPWLGCQAAVLEQASCAGSELCALA